MAFVLVALVMTVWFGRDLAYELDGGGMPGTLSVQRCDSHVERVNHRGYTEKRRVYRCTGRFTGEGGAVAQDVHVRSPVDERSGAAVPVVQVHGDAYELPSERNPAGYVMGLGVAAVVLAIGVFGVLTGYALRSEDDLRTSARSLPARRVLGPLLAAVAAGGAVTAVIAGFLR